MMTLTLRAHRRTILLGVIFSLANRYQFALATEPPTSAVSAEAQAAGKLAYENNCARCHGATGAGDGRDAKLMYPKPRNLADGIFKFRTTASGTPPTDEDLLHTLSTGLPGSRMPDFQRLPEETRRQLVGFVKSLSPVFEQQKPESIPMGTDPGPKKANLARGKEVYAQLGCASCHGTLGRGNGPSAAGLMDNWNRPIRAADLTHGWSYRAGSDPKDIVARVLTGIDGAPMPSYADALAVSDTKVSDTAVRDAWHLAYFVHSLQETPNFGRVIEATKASGGLPATLEDPQWQKTPRTDLRLSSLFYQNGEIQTATVTAISVQALYNDQEILFRLSWHDPTESRGVPSETNPHPLPDALALVLNPDRRQKMRVGSLRNWPETPESAALASVRWSAETPSSAASYNDGEWAVLLKGPVMKPEQPVLMGAAVWDGGNGEEGRRRGNSNWVNLILK